MGWPPREIQAVTGWAHAWRGDCPFPGTAKEVQRRQNPSFDSGLCRSLRGTSDWFQGRSLAGQVGATHLNCVENTLFHFL